MITLSWIIERLLVKPTEGSLTDVVITADWRCNGTQDQYSGTCYGSCSFAPPSGEFTPYDELTEAQVLNWCYANRVDQAAIEANVTQQINDQINPPVVTLPLPWFPKTEGVSSGVSFTGTPATLRSEQIVDPFILPTSDVPPSVDGMTNTILG
jgi:hypothetical protein